MFISNPSTRLVLGFTSFSALPTRLDYIRLPLYSHRPRCHRRRFITASASPSYPSNDSNPKKKIVFLGTPQVAANSLKTMHDASLSPTSTFTIAAVVTQPPALSGRKRQLRKSPVHQMAEQLSIEPILTPKKASNKEFLSAMEDMCPDLCITAAYGNFLPARFLVVPNFGTLNIHPSLLPQFRGAAPVARALQAGVPETGVCVLITVLKMDAGPIVARRTRALQGDERKPELLDELVATGTEALLEVLPNVWNDTLEIENQNDALASHAPKLSSAEARVSFTESATIVHNQVRAFAGWPGSWADFVVMGDKGDEQIRLKIGRTVILKQDGGISLGIHEVAFREEHNCLDITCGDGSKIGLLEVQPPGKKLMDARSFWNGLRGKKIHRKRVPY